MARTISQLAAKTIVYLLETVGTSSMYIPYLYLGLDESGKARLLRKRCIFSGGKINSTSVSDYAGTDIDSWLNDAENGWLACLDAATRAALTETSIAYVDFTSGSGEIKTISRKVFLMSYTEMGFSATSAGSEGQSYFNSNSARKASRDNSPTSDTSQYWTRSGASSGRFKLISPSGGSTSTTATTPNYLRPALSVAATTAVSDADAPNVVLLPDTHDAYWEFALTIGLGDTTARAKKAKVFFPGDVVYTTKQLCNNYNDTTPTWENVDSDDTVEFANTTKTAASWGLGAKIVARFYDSAAALGEPAVIVEFDEAEQGE